MARSIHRLTARFVATAPGPRNYADGDGLYLQVTANGARSWLYVFQWRGRRVEMGLGSAGRGGIGLADARRARDEARQQVREGTNPVAVRRIEAEKASYTFGAVASETIAQLAPGWRNEKNPKQWMATLSTHAAAIWDMPVSDITTEHVLEVLTPIWATKPETARKLRGRIERVLRAAKVRGLRSGENPAAWRDHLQVLLPSTRKLSRGHHPAMPYVELPEFLALLRARPALAARALELVILTGSRTREARLATWAEIDWESAVWIRPADHMKGGREHRVPLSGPVLDLLRRVRLETGDGEYLFPSPGGEKPLSDGALERVLDRMKLSHFTVHGFRSSFRDWVGEATEFPSDLAEMSLSHLVGGDVERAYRRGDMLERRRALMEAWAAYCCASYSGMASIAA